MAESLQSIGLANGGRAGSRLAARLGMPASRMTLLRLVRAAPCPPAPTPTALGVDDFALRRGNRYGTLLYDLETHHVIDMLPDRSAESLAAWLRVRPQVEIISRDRGGIYAQGAREGAPQAKQVADRWHLLDNLADALVRVLSQHQTSLYQAALARSSSPPLAEEAVPAPLSAEEPAPDPPSPKHNKAQAQSNLHRTARRERFEKVRSLHLEGHTNQEIVAHLRMGAGTVARFLKAEHFPERVVRRPMPSKLARFHVFVQQRWQAGCHDFSLLLEELRQQGYTGCRSRVYAFLPTLRVQDRPECPLPSTPASAKFSPREVASILLKRERTPEEQSLLDRLVALSPPLETARQVAEGFVTLLRHRTPEAEPALAKWVAETKASSFSALAGFARGLEEDWSAVIAAFSLEWSNGPVEGAINRLKMIKRQMYGRANFDLLRKRVMLA